MMGGSRAIPRVAPDSGVQLADEAVIRKPAVGEAEELSAAMVTYSSLESLGRGR